MKTVLIFGASATHGVGGERGGWADKLKLWLHAQQFSPNGQGELCTVYELGVPGNTARDVINRFEAELLARLPGKAPEETFIIFSAGTNDSKAVNQADNFPTSADEYATNVHAFIRLAREHSRHVIVMGLHPIDQSKTNPKHSPLTGNKSYFTNERIKAFDAAAGKVCKAQKATFLPVFEQVPNDWLEKYLNADGLHPNDAGHEWLFAQLQPKLKRLLRLQ